MKNVQVKSFQKVSKASAKSLSQFEGTINQLRVNNAELSVLHQDVDAEILGLQALKESIKEQIATNQAAINGLEQVIGK